MPRAMEPSAALRLPGTSAEERAAREARARTRRALTRGGNGIGRRCRPKFLGERGRCRLAAAELRIETLRCGTHLQRGFCLRGGLRGSLGVPLGLGLRLFVLHRSGKRAHRCVRLRWHVCAPPGVNDCERSPPLTLRPSTHGRRAAAAAAAAGQALASSALPNGVGGRIMLEAAPSDVFWRAPPKRGVYDCGAGVASFSAVRSAVLSSAMRSARAPPVDVSSSHALR